MYLTLAAWLLRRGHDLTLLAVGAVFVVIQAFVGLASHSPTVYLAQPVLLSALWGLAFFVSIAIGRPLIGVFAAFGIRSRLVPRRRGLPTGVRHAVVRLGSRVSRAGGAPAVGAARLRVGGFVVVSIVTGTPLLAALIAWGIWHARRTFSQLDEPAPEAR